MAARAAKVMVPVTEAREKLKEILDEVEREPVILVRHSRPAAIMISPAHYSELLDTIEHLEAQCSVLRARVDPGDFVPLDKVEAEAGLLPDG